MANTAAIISATPSRQTWLLTGDGTVAGPTITNAQLLAAAERNGPLRELLSATYANQAAMRLVFDGSGARILLRMRTTVADTTAEVNQPSADVDVDAVTATAPEINCTMSDTTGTVAILIIEAVRTVDQ